MSAAPILRYSAAWDAQNNKGALVVLFGDPASPEKTRIDADSAQELAALLAILKASNKVSLVVDDVGRTYLQSDWANPG
ncbi:MAG: hypothetical protein SFY96_10915 [Planctomycetota bacterium]|nr:hypothetical protein [Planctomycetota bacterium]